MTLDEVLAEAFGLLTAAVADRDSPLRLLTLASVAADGTPDLRTLILRGCDPQSRMIMLHTDLRSAKVAQLRRTPAVALHGWEPAQRLQLRLYGTASLHAGDASARAAWQALPALGRQLYRVRQSPGDKLPDPAATQFDEAPEADGFASLAVITITISQLETLRLTGHGQHRARFSWTRDRLAASWLVP